MRQEHSDDISIDQLALLVEKSAHPAADPLEVLVRYEKVGSEDRSVCPLCPFAIENTRIPEPRSLIPDASVCAEDAKAMRDHVAEHLESIALLSLPEQEIDDAASDEVQSESARISSHGEVHGLEPPPHLTSEDWDNYNKMAVAPGLDSAENVQGIVPPSDYEDWSFVTSTKIGALCNKLELPKVVADLAEQMFEIAQNAGVFQGDPELTLSAGCILIACDRCKTRLTFREIYQPMGVSELRVLKKLDFFFGNQDANKIKASSFDPGRDPVLLPFVERARRIQTAEIQREIGIPLIVISDPGGLEIPEAQWVDKPEQWQADTVSATKLYNVGPSSSADNQRMRKIQEAKSESFSVPDSLPSVTKSRPQGIPTITVEDAGV
ncbi:MAG: hypothetical protein L6R42_009206 [Xanthoria sp. 1 TBL-2021]|nr:MAG: hypothetical protein L6R42_009206 [Xanthoria sp. 1 TBL-2021]